MFFYKRLMITELKFLICRVGARVSELQKQEISIHVASCNHQWKFCHQKHVIVAILVMVGFNMTRSLRIGDVFDYRQPLRFAMGIHYSKVACTW